MRIGEITNSAEYQMDEQNQNWPMFGIKLWFSELKKKFPNFKISKIIKFPLLTNSKKNNQKSEIVEFQKLANFLIWQFVKLSKFKKFRIWW